VLTAGNGDTLGFVARFFDRNCVGTLERDDIEDIAFMTAPPISRAQMTSVCSCPRAGAGAGTALEWDLGSSHAPTYYTSICSIELGLCSCIAPKLPCCMLL
jgi:hypothetical protein